MKKTQLEYLQKVHSRYLQAKETQPPHLVTHVRHALATDHTMLKVLPAADILKAAAKAMAEHSYSSEGSRVWVSELFHPPASYLAAKKEHAAALKDREARLKKYRLTADALMLQAELEDTADAKVIAIGLERAARAAGLIE